MTGLRVTVLAAACLLVTGCRSTSRLEVVTDFDIDRYLGIWYEAARMPHGFEEDLSSVSANYILKEDGSIRVINRGFNDRRQEWEEIEGVAKFKGDKDRGWLKVSFFRPFYASYKIIHLSDDYAEAIVTGPSYGYLWILVRDPASPQERIEQLISKAGEFGFDTGQLLLIDQDRNIP